MPKETKTQQAVAAYDWSQSGVTGFETVGKEDLGIPFLMIIQKGSPEVDKTHKDYPLKKVPGAEAGDIINTISRQVVYKNGGDKPIRFVPCGYERSYVEWAPRERGGGVVRMHKNANILAECTRNEKNQDVHRNGNLVVTTAYFYGLVLGEDGRQPAIISLTSTQLKKARVWLNIASNIKVNGPKGPYTPPLFSHEYLLTTVPESNNKGSWMGWHVELGPMLTDPAAIAESIETSRKAMSGQRAALPPASEESEAIPFA